MKQDLHLICFNLFQKWQEKKATMWREEKIF